MNLFTNNRRFFINYLSFFFLFQSDIKFESESFYMNDKLENIKPFGKFKTQNLAIYTQTHATPKFIRTDIMEEESEEDQGIYVYKPGSYAKPTAKVDDNIYVPSSLKSVPTTVKIINLDAEIDKIILEKLIIKLTSNHPLSTYVVLDRDTRESRGYAYVMFSSEEQAKDAIKKIDGHVIDGLILGAEIAKEK